MNKYSNLDFATCEIKIWLPFFFFFSFFLTILFSLFNIFIAKLFSFSSEKSITFFKIDLSNGMLVLGDAKLNYWYSSSYIVTIQVTDNGSPHMSLEKNITINIDDVLRLPTDILLSDNTVKINLLFFVFRKVF